MNRSINNVHPFKYTKFCDIFLILFYKQATSQVSKIKF